MHRPSSALGVGPFEVNGQQIAVLNAHELADLLRRLLLAEARTHGVPVSGVHVAGNIYTPDGSGQSVLRSAVESDLLWGEPLPHCLVLGKVAGTLRICPSTLGSGSSV